MNNVFPLPTRSVNLSLLVHDPEVVHELEQRDEGDARTRFALEALRLGVLALRQASGSLDADVIRRESEKMLSSVEAVFQTKSTELSAQLEKTVVQFFDPKSGALPQRLEQLTKPNGDLDAMLTRHLTGDQSMVAQTLAKHVGANSPLFKLLSPSQSDGLLAALASTLKQALDAQRDQVVREFSLDRKESALSKMLGEMTATNGKLRSDLAGDVEKVSKEFSLDNPNGALTRLVKQMDQAQKTITKEFSLDHDGSALQKLAGLLEKTNAAVETSLTLDDDGSPLARLKRELVTLFETQRAANSDFQADVRAKLEAITVQRKEVARTASHGTSFEDEVVAFLTAEAKRVGDSFEGTGAKPGKGTSKTGDGLLELGEDSAAPGALVAFEAKSRKNYSLKAARAEIAEARANRDAQVGVFVFDRVHAPEGQEPLVRIGNDVFVVWDAEDPQTDIVLRAAFAVARTLVIRERQDSERSEHDFDAMEKLVIEISKHIAVLETIEKSARSIRTNGDKVANSAEAMRESLERQVKALHEAVDVLRTASVG